MAEAVDLGTLQVRFKNTKKMKNWTWKYFSDIIWRAGTVDVQKQEYELNVQLDWLIYSFFHYVHKSAKMTSATSFMHIYHLFLIQIKETLGWNQGENDKENFGILNSRFVSLVKMWNFVCESLNG